VLLCSDGLTDMLGEDEIAAVLLDADRDPERAAELLVAAANGRGGEDNITVVLFELVEGEPEAVTAVELSDDGEREETTDGDEADVSRHGAGSGGRLASLALIAGVVVVGALALYWGIGR
jgi:protein phosphatase